MLRRLVMLLCLLALPALADDEPIEFGDYHALVIGNNDYAFLPRLETAVSDAAALAELLRSRYAFKDVKLLLNARRADILREMNRLRATLTSRDNLLIYYAGHGYVDPAAEEGFWQPVDARDDEDTQWISNGTLTRYLKTMTAKHVMVVADSCYSGTLLRDGGTGPAVGAERTAFLRRMASKRARVALASGGLEPVADSGANGHSVFANALLTALRDNTDVIDGQSLFQRIKRPVVLNAQQTPQYADVRNAEHDGGDFLFVPASVLAATPATPAPPRSESAGGDTALELAFWDSVKDSDNRAALQAYLARYPDGVFASLARIKLAELEDASAEETQTALLTPPPKPKLVPVEAIYVALKNANVRAEPSVASQRVETLSAGAEVLVAGRTEDGDWLAIERDGEPAGYVYAPLLRDKAEVDAEQAAARAEAERAARQQREAAEARAELERQARARAAAQDAARARAEQVQRERDRARAESERKAAERERARQAEAEAARRERERQAALTPPDYGDANWTVKGSCGSGASVNYERVQFAGGRARGSDWRMTLDQVDADTIRVEGGGTGFGSDGSTSREFVFSFEARRQDDKFTGTGRFDYLTGFGANSYCWFTAILHRSAGG